MRTASARSSSRKKVFDEFDKQESTQGTEIPSLLFYKEQPDSRYSIIRDSILDKRSKSKVNEAAIKIQSTYRMYALHSKFKSWFAQIREANRATKLPYFAMIILNSFNKSEGRVAIYESLRECALAKKRYNEGYYMPSFQGFTITNQILIPYYISEYTLVQFVKLCYRKLIRDMFMEWRLITAQAKRRKRQLQRHRTDEISKSQFGIYYVCFQLWYQWHLEKHPKRDKGSAALPEWNHHIKVQEAKTMRIRKACQNHHESLKVNALAALKHKVSKNRQISNSKKKADDFRLEQNGNLALRAWMKYLVDEKNKATVKRVVYFKWLGHVKKKKHFNSMLESFQQRHALYLKHTGFDAFAKNKRVEHILSTYSYLKIHQKPSLALFLISFLRNDRANEVVAHGFSAWHSLCKRRKQWQQFIHEDVNRSEYDMTKRRALSVLLNRHSPVPPINTIDSKAFQRETVTIYQNAMQSPPTDMSLLITDDSRAAAYQLSERKVTGRVQMRELFFKVWRNEVNETSTLFKRCIVLNTLRLRKDRHTEKEQLDEQSRKTFTKAVQYLASLNLASEGAFSAARRAIEENNKRALHNRVFVTHRNTLILCAHESHKDAADLRRLLPSFTLNDSVKVDGTDIKYKTLIPCDQLGDIISQQNETVFSTVIGCTTQLPSYKEEIKTLHKQIQEELMRIELGHDSMSRFDRLLAGKNDAHGRNGISNIMRIDPFRRVIKVQDQPGPITGFNGKLNSNFPSIGRRARIIKNKATKGLEFGRQQTINFTEDYLDDEDLGESMAEQRLSLTAKRSMDSQIFKMSATLSKFLRRTSEVLAAPVETVISEESESSSGRESDVIIEEAEEEAVEKVEKVEVTAKPAKAELNLQAVNAEFPANVKQTVGTRDMFDRAKRHRDLLEMMFGRQSKDNHQMNVLRNKLVYEYRHRKPSLAATGIETRGLSRPVTAVAEKYREDSMTENGRSRQPIAEQAKKIARKRRKRDDDDEFSCKYDSRKYKCAFASSVEEEDFVDDDDMRMDLLEHTISELPKAPKTKKIRIRKHKDGSTSVSSAMFSGLSSSSLTGDAAGGNETSNASGIQSHSHKHSHHRHRTDNAATNVNEAKTPGGSRTPASATAHGTPSKGPITSPGVLPKGKIIDEDYEYDYDYDSSYSYEVVEVPIDEDESAAVAEINDSEFDPAEKRRKRVRFAQFEFDRATPFVTRTVDDGSTISKVNKVVFHILEKTVEEEGPEGLLVEVDPDDIPGLSLQGGDGASRFHHSWNKPKFYPIWKPKCSYNKRGPLFDPNRKPDRPIVVENKPEITRAMKEIVSEINPLSRLLYTNGRSTTKHRKPVETPIFQPVYKTINPMKLSSDSRSGSIVEDGVVSFAGGGRSVGRNSGNFVTVRVANSRQKKIGRPMTAMNNPAEARAMSVNAAVSQKQRAEKDEHELHDTISLVVSDLASTVTDAEFEQLRRRSRAMHVQQGGKDGSSAADLVVKLKTARNDLKAERETPQVIATRVLSMFQNSREHNQVLVRTLDNKAREKTTKKKYTDDVDVTKIDPSIRINFVDTNWSGDIDYNAVAVQYNNHANELDALIGPTVASEKTETRSRRATTSQVKKQEPEDFLEDYDMEEMMRILPYIITEQEIDIVLQQSTR